MTCVFADPSREPALERAMPADAVPGSMIPEDTEAEILLRDGTWVWAQVIGQRRDRHGRWCIGLRWYASPAVGGREGWYLYDPELIRRPPLAGGALARCAQQVTAMPRCLAVISQADTGKVPDKRIFLRVLEQVPRFQFLDQPLEDGVHMTTLPPSQ